MSPLTGAALLIMAAGFLLMFVGASEHDGRRLPTFVGGLALLALGCTLFGVSFTQPKTLPETEQGQP